MFGYQGNERFTSADPLREVLPCRAVQGWGKEERPFKVARPIQRVFQDYLGAK